MDFSKLSALRSSTLLTRLRESAFADYIDELREDPRRLRRAGLLAATVAVALGSGQLMESMAAGDVRQEPVVVAEAPVAAPVSVPVAPAPAPVQSAEAVLAGDAVAPLAMAAPRPAPETLLPAATPLHEPEIAALDLASITPLSAEVEPVKTTSAACDAPDLRLSEQEHGVISISLLAPCTPDTEVTISQLGLFYKVKTDHNGHYFGIAPALSGAVSVEARLATGEHVRREISLLQRPEGAHVALVWSGHKGFGLNAYEYHAEYGSAGHVRASAARIPGTALGGYLLRLGDQSLAEPALADVYIAPAGLTDVQFDIEAEVNDATCTKDISAQLLRSDAAGATNSETVSFAMPDCGGAGDVVVLPVPEASVAMAAIR